MSNSSAQTAPSTRRSYFLGLAMEFIPLVVFTTLLMGFGPLLEAKIGLLLAPLVWLVSLGSYLLELILAIGNLAHPARRTRGYGLLTALLLSLLLAGLVLRMFQIIFS